MADASGLPLEMGVLDVDLRSLREARQLLMGRLGGYDPRILGPELSSPIAK